ncbi:MAG: TetR/AcrR family transcriptional regulator [Jatrophihabitans sp.]
MVRTRDGRPAHTAESLLTVAVEVFTARGYDGTSMEHLAAASGLSKSSIYHHVASKEELLRRALDRALGALFAVLDEPGAITGSASDRVGYVVRRETETLLAEQPYVTLLLRVRGNSPMEQDALRRRREFDQRMTELVQVAISAGEFRSDADPAVVTRLVFGMVNSLIEWWRPDRGDPQVVVDAVLSLVLDGLRAS